MASRGSELSGERGGHCGSVSPAWEAWLPLSGANPWGWEGVLREGLSRAYLLIGSLVPDQELGLGQASGTEGGWVEVSLGPGKDLPFCLVLFFS